MNINLVLAVNETDVWLQTVDWPAIPRMGEMVQVAKGAEALVGRVVWDVANIKDGAVYVGLTNLQGAGETELETFPDLASAGWTEG